MRGLPSQDEFRPADLLQLIWLRRWLIAVIALCGLVAGITTATLMTPVYRAETVVSPVGDGSGSLNGLLGDYAALADIAAINLNVSNNGKEEAVATLKSRAFGERFISDRQLLPVLFEDEWDAGHQQWRDSDPKKQPQLWDGWRVFDEEVRHVTEDRRTGLVSLAIEWHDPALAAEWANDLVSRLNDQVRARDVAEAERSIEYLNGQLRQGGLLEVKESIYTLLEAQLKVITLASARNDYAFRVIDPALIPDPSRPVRPRLVVMAALGTLAGLFVSIGVILLMAFNAGVSAPLHASRALRGESPHGVERGLVQSGGLPTSI